MERKELLTSDIKCCSDIVHRRAKRLITLQLWTTQRNGPSLYSQISTFAAASIASVIGAGLGFGAGLIGAGVGSFWKTVTSSSQTVQTSVQTDSRNPIPPSLTSDIKCCPDIVHERTKKCVDGVQVILLAFVGTLAAVDGLIDVGIGLSLLIGAGSAWKGKTTSHHFINYRSFCTHYSNKGNNEYGGMHHLFILPLPCQYYYI
ncbi:hypothetical protein DINM_006727 [Dirofilaria immitis]|nr:hypothetical protein [Dirofilaria immitis]